MVAIVPLLTPFGGYYTTFYNHISMVLTPLRDPGKTMVEPHFILQGCIPRILIVFVLSGTHLQSIGLSVLPFDLPSQQASHFSALILMKSYPKPSFSRVTHIKLYSKESKTFSISAANNIPSKFSCSV